MTTASELWLDDELSRVVRKPLPRFEVQRDTPPQQHVSRQNVGNFATSSASSNVSPNVMRSPYGYGYAGPALTDEDVRRIEHPEEFR